MIMILLVYLLPVGFLAILSKSFLYPPPHSPLHGYVKKKLLFGLYNGRLMKSVPSFHFRLCQCMGPFHKIFPQTFRATPFCYCATITSDCYYVFVICYIVRRFVKYGNQLTRVEMQYQKLSIKEEYNGLHLER